MRKLLQHIYRNYTYGKIPISKLNDFCEANNVKVNMERFHKKQEVTFRNDKYNWRYQ